MTAIASLTCVNCCDNWCAPPVDDGYRRRVESAAEFTASEALDIDDESGRPSPKHDLVASLDVVGTIVGERDPLADDDQLEIASVDPRRTPGRVLVAADFETMIRIFDDRRQVIGERNVVILALPGLP